MHHAHGTAIGVIIARHGSSGQSFSQRSIRALNVPLADGQVTRPTGFTITELLRKGT